MTDESPRSYDAVPVTGSAADADARSPWRPAQTLRRLVEGAGADAGLLDDLADVRRARVDDA